MKSKLIKILLLVLGTAALVSGCQSVPDNSEYFSQDFPPAQLVKQATP
jgi:hypothetical protein